MPPSTLTIAVVQRAASDVGLSGSVNDHVAMHQALTQMGVSSSLHHFRANCAQGTMRQIITGVALEVKGGVFLLTGELGWNDIRSKVATELNAQSKGFAFSHHPIHVETQTTIESSVHHIVEALQNVACKGA